MRAMRGRAGANAVPGIGVAGSLGFHALVILLFLTAGASKPRPPLLLAYRVELLAGPAPAPAAAPASAAAPAPVSPPVPRPAPAPSRSPAPAPAPSRTPPAPTVAPRPAAPAMPAPSRRPGAPPVAPPSPAAATPNPPGPTAAPGAAPSTGTAPTTIRTEGVEFPFPGYLRNLVAQVYRRWRPPAGNEALQAEVFFLVHRDGTVTGLQFIRRSGSFAFDLEAQGAIEAAVRAGAFGTLPEGYGADVLPVSFFFSPGTGR